MPVDDSTVAMLAWGEINMRGFVVTQQILCLHPYHHDVFHCLSSVGSSLRRAPTLLTIRMYSEDLTLNLPKLHRLFKNDRFTTTSTQTKPIHTQSHLPHTKVDQDDFSCLSTHWNRGYFRTEELNVRNDQTLQLIDVW